MSGPAVHLGWAAATWICTAGIHGCCCLECGVVWAGASHEQECRPQERWCLRRQLCCSLSALAGHRGLSVDCSIMFCSRQSTGCSVRPLPVCRSPPKLVNKLTPDKQELLLNATTISNSEADPLNPMLKGSRQSPAKETSAGRRSPVLRWSLVDIVRPSSLIDNHLPAF